MDIMNKLEQLKLMTTVVADTGDIEAIKQWQPQDATTNPSLLLKAASLEQYKHLVSQSIKFGQDYSKNNNEAVSAACDHLAVSIGTEILKYIPGRVSTEVDARLSFNTQATIEKAKNIIELYTKNGISKDRVLIKIASTWEGIQAAKTLEQEGIQCNLTLLFSFVQAAAAAEANAFLISPFVGRILDWYKKSTGKTNYSANEDPGVLSVSEIFKYYKACGYKTIVMGASFRNIEEIEELAGCDRLTISPDLLEKLANDSTQLTRKLSADNVIKQEKYLFDEAAFRWQLNQDAMATEKLAEGIRKFAEDQVALEQLLSEQTV